MESKTRISRHVFDVRALRMKVVDVKEKMEVEWRPTVKSERERDNPPSYKMTIKRFEWRRFSFNLYRTASGNGDRQETMGVQKKRASRFRQTGRGISENC